MGPKGKTSKSRDRQKRASETASVKRQINQMEGALEQLKNNLHSLNIEYSKITAELLAKQHTVDDLNKKIIEINICLENLTNQKNSGISAIANLKREVNNQQHRISRKKKVFACNSRFLLSYDNVKTLSFSITSSKVRKRKSAPFSDDISPRSKVRRCNETYDVCSLIHAGGKANKVSVLKGILETVGRKFSSSDVVDELNNSKNAITQKLSQNCINSWHNNFYKSDENRVRSLNVYYSHNVMGKQKYKAIRKANRNSLFQRQRVSNYIPYPDLANYINSLDIGVLRPLCPDLVSLDEMQGKPAVGMFRDVCEHIQRLAKFYLTVNQYRTDKLLTFDNFLKKDESSFLFLISFGGDGAPGVGTVFAVSFLNIGKRILSSSGTFMLFGGEVEESSLPARKFLKKAIADFIYLESKVFSVNVNSVDVKVEFKLAELPNDMKMLCFLAGELSNAAKYFTTFADVNTDNYRQYDKSYGKDWKPFTYEKRIEDSAKVSRKKNELAKSTNAEATKRQKLTSYISNVLRSRQEEVPLVKHYISVAKCEPLHIKNNVCKELFIRFWKDLFGTYTFVKIKSFINIPADNIFCIFVTFVRKEMKLNKLAGKMVTWFNETNRGVDRDFKYRFTGQESYALLKYFPKLISKFILLVDAKVKKRFLQYFYQLLHIRKLISYSVRLTDFNSSDLDEMKISGKMLFKACCLSGTSLSPSMWVLCNIAPSHARETLSLYGLGLGINSMEAREQKHQKVKKYAENTTFQNKWPMIFRHEFLQEIFLRERGFDEITYSKKQKKYLPDFLEGSCLSCGLNLAQNSCPLCTQVDSLSLPSLFS